MRAEARVPPEAAAVAVAAVDAAPAILALLDSGGIEAALAAVPPEPASAPVQAALGMVLLAAARPEEAAGALRAAIARGDASPATRLNLAIAEDRAGACEAAARRMRAVAEALPAWDEPWLRLAESLRRRGRAAEAIAAYEEALARAPARPEALLGLAGLLLAGSRDAIAKGAGGIAAFLARARSLARAACAAAPGRAEAWDALGVALLLAGDAARAEAAFARAQALAPADIPIALHRVEAAHVAGTGTVEAARLAIVSVADPGAVAPLAARGALLARMGETAEAIDLLEAAAALAPDDADIAALLADVLARANRVTAAEAACRRARALAPADTGLMRNHAALLLRLQRHRECRALLEEVTAGHGETAGDLSNLSMALTGLGLQAQGVATSRRAIGHAPGAHFAWRNLCAALAYDDETTGADLSAAYRACAALARRDGAGAISAPAGGPPDPYRRLRLGLLSADLRCHPVGWLTIAGFEHLDPAAFEIVCFAQPDPDDLMGRRFRAIAAEWHVVDPGDRDAVVRAVRAARIDVLIDLGGYGDRGMLVNCARRLAPVQIKWVGTQNHTTGLPEMDWFISDRWETPPALAHLYTERLLILPDGYVCYTAPPYAPEVGPLPAARHGAVTFGCFNNLAKVTPRAIALWARVLRRVTDARLVLASRPLSDDQTAAEVRDRCAAGGIDPARLELRGGASHRGLLASYNEIDIALDPMPYSGGLTTCEALWMGVPTVTLPGDTFASRHSTSHLCNVGLSDWVAADPAEYVAIAAARAADRPGLAALRAGLRARVRASPLGDAPRFGRHLGAALRHAWRAWCARSRGEGEIGSAPNLETHDAPPAAG